MKCRQLIAKFPYKARKQRKGDNTVKKNKGRVPSVPNDFTELKK